MIGFILIFSGYVTMPTVSAISASSAIAVECSNFDVYFDAASSERCEIASVTKIMTVVVAMELCMDRTRIVSVPDEAIGVEGTSIYLKRGEQMSIDDLIWAVLLNSANDAATALAIIVSGSVDSFVSSMNAKAYALCMNDTHYVNPHGLPAEDHYSSARDLAVLACYALSVDGFIEISSSYTHLIPYDGMANGRQLVNHNRLIKSYDGCIGMKTGFTKSAGRCLVSAACRDGVTVVCVTLRDPNDWQDHAELLDLGFSTFERVLLSYAGEQGAGIPVAGSDETALCSNREEISAVLRRERGQITKTVLRPSFLYSPISSDKRVGSVLYRCDGKTVGTGDLLTMQEMP